MARVKNAKAYARLQAKQKDRWENICRRCGACCGVVDGDPCENLVQIKDRVYICKDYENRLGEHRTRSGQVMKCVNIRDILHKSWPGADKCAYRRM